MSTPDISAEQIKDLVADLDTKGFACILNYVSAQDLARMQSFVARAVKQSSRQYVHFNGTESLRGSGVDDIARSPAFIKLMHDIFEQGTGKRAVIEDFHTVLRCLTGTSGQNHSMIFHYDSYLVTALVPVEIPSQGLKGDLLLYPNTRNVRSSYLLNVLDKVLVDNPITQAILRAFAGTLKLAPKRIEVCPGNLYLFWGYRSLHTNEPCDPDKVRATALFHYFKPHGASILGLLGKS